MNICGIATVSTAEIITQTGNPTHYITRVHHAMANGTAPTAASSDRITYHRLNHRGNPDSTKATTPQHPHKSPNRTTKTEPTTNTTHNTVKTNKTHTKPQTQNLRPHLDTPPTRQKHNTKTGIATHPAHHKPQRRPAPLHRRTPRSRSRSATTETSRDRRKIIQTRAKYTVLGSWKLNKGKHNKNKTKVQGSTTKIRQKCLSWCHAQKTTAKTGTVSVSKRLGTAARSNSCR